MPVNTPSKRISAVAVRRLPWLRRFAILPDGSIDKQDRKQAALVYRGLTPSTKIVRRTVRVSGARVDE